MPLQLGDKLGPYEILAPLGAGGMGEVWKASDPRLNRIVAIKVSRDQFSERSEREARSAAALNHPHICTIYDVGPDYLVMEYLEGDTLAARIARGPVPLQEALTLAIQMADALDHAHRKGVVHRDVKPGNVMLTKSGATLLDFGLAKLAAPTSSASGSQDAHATQTMGVTTPGTIIGTFQYMSPEQVEGKEADARSDIFSFGVLLYEMVTARKAFFGKSQVSLLAAILEAEPAPPSTVTPSLPRDFERLIQVCLAKDAEDRYQSAREIVRDLKWIQAAPEQLSAGAPNGPASKMRWASGRWGWSAAVIALVAGVGLAAVHFTERASPRPVVRFNVLPPEGTAFPGTTPRMAISPDGTQLAFQFQGSQGKQQMWVRRLDSVEARAIPGTENAETPFWSPDSRFIGFFADNKLKRVEAAGGPVQILCDGPGNDGGGTWNRDGIILFSGRNPDLSVMRVADSGGVPVRVTKLGPREVFHRWPRFLPDGRHFLYLASSANEEDGGVYVFSLDGMQPKRILASPFMADYADGYLLYRVDQALMARPFDVNKLEFRGDPVPVLPSVGALANNGRLGFSVSSNGYMAFSEGSGGDITHLVWLDRTGKELGPEGMPGALAEPRLSPDGKQVVFSRLDIKKPDVWLIDLARGVPSRLTFLEGETRYPVWSPDGKTVAFSSSRSGGRTEIYSKAVSGLGEDQLLLKADGFPMAMDWSPDGRFLLYSFSRGGNRDIFALPLQPKGDPVAVQATSFDESGARFSPDGHWIAFVTTESGNSEVNVRSFPGNERKIQISPDIGVEPAWRRDGRELFYISFDYNGNRKLMAVPIKSLNPFESGAPVALFPTTTFQSAIVMPSHYAPSPDGSKFLFLMPVAQTQTHPITVVQNWTAGLKK